MSIFLENGLICCDASFPHYALTPKNPVNYAITPKIRLDYALRHYALHFPHYAITQKNWANYALRNQKKGLLRHYANLYPPPCSLCYQIEEAKELKYSQREIVSGMIKAMKDPLRKYCEGKVSWSLEALMKSIRSYAKVKDADKMMDQMKARCQETTETEIDFLTKMCTLRDNILAMTKQEEHPKNEALVKKHV